MDTTQLYTTEDSGNILDNNTTAWINNAVLVDSENIVWHENGPEITVDYSEITDQTLTENEGYVTANTDVDETSEYFSILSADCNNTQGEICTFDGSKYQAQEDPSECIMNIEVQNEEVILPDLTKVEKIETEDEDKEEGDVILYQVEGKDEWYAEQLIDDGTGQFKTYRYKVSQNADGQFEAIPGTLEVHDMYAENYNKDDQMELEENVNIKEEENICESDFTQAIKTEGNCASMESTSDVDENYEDITEPKYSLPADNETQFASSYLMDSSNEDNYYEDQIEYGDSEDSQKVNVIHEDGKIASISVLSSMGSINSESEYEIEELEEDFQDDFTIKDEYGDTNISEILGNAFQSKEAINEYPESKPIRIAQVEIPKNIRNRSYYLINMTEKENISVTNAVENIPTQFKSILKSNFASNNINFPKPKTIEIQNPQIPTNTVENETIEKSPIVKKSSRPPRKQVIIPVERAGSEIIVQPLIYPLENIPDIRSSYVKRTRNSNEIYQVSDESDPEFTLKPVKKKKFKRSKYTPRSTRQTKTIEITISDTDEENTNENYVINLLSDQESESEDDNSKNRAGKSINVKKKINNTNELIDNESDDVEKKKPQCNDTLILPNKNNLNNGENDIVPFTDAKVEDDKKNIRKNNIKCPMCPKTFPRSANLKSHMNIHNARRVLRSKIMTRNKTNVADRSINSLNQIKNDTTGKTFTKNTEYNCEKCGLKFLTEAQYIRHQTIHSKPKLTTNLDNLRTKSEDDINENLIDESKCKYCDAIFYCKDTCADHENAHKTYPCPKCMTIFTAKSLLDKHMRSNACKHKRKKIFNATGVKCLLCKKVFCSAETLKKHTSLHHKGETVDDSVHKKCKGLRNLPKKPNKKDGN